LKIRKGKATALKVVVNGLKIAMAAAAAAKLSSTYPNDICDSHRAGGGEDNHEHVR
jgi:hypothetical protein